MGLIYDDTMGLIYAIRYFHLYAFFLGFMFFYVKSMNKNNSATQNIVAFGHTVCFPAGKAHCSITALTNKHKPSLCSSRDNAVSTPFTFNDRIRVYHCDSALVSSEIQL